MRCSQCNHTFSTILFSEVRVDAPDGGGLVGPIHKAPMCGSCTIRVVTDAVLEYMRTDIRAMVRV